MIIYLLSITSFLFLRLSKVCSVFNFYMMSNGKFLIFLLVFLSGACALSVSAPAVARRKSHAAVVGSWRAVPAMDDESKRADGSKPENRNRAETKDVNRRRNDFVSREMVKQPPCRMPITLIGPLAHPVGCSMQRWSEKLLVTSGPPMLSTTLASPRTAALLDLASSMRVQRLLGVDVGIDGGHHTDRMIFLFMKQFTNVEFQKQVGTDAKPRMKVTGRLVPKFLWEDMKGSDSLVGVWKAAQKASISEANDQGRNPIHVKAVIPGPMTLYDALDMDESLFSPGADGGEPAYKSPREVHTQLAVQLSFTLRDLVDAGCTHIQIDEPGMLSRPVDALSYGVNLLDQIVMKSVSDYAGLTFTLHACSCRPIVLSEKDTDFYVDLAKRLDESQVHFLKKFNQILFYFLRIVAIMFRCVFFIVTCNETIARRIG